MNGYNKNRSQNQARSTRTLKVAPTTRAIRAALAVSATVLALSGSGLAFAGTCTIPALQTVSCDGVFNETVPGTIFVPPLDLTLIVGANSPTSVTPPVGDIGILAIGPVPAPSSTTPTSSPMVPTALPNTPIRSAC